MAEPKTKLQKGNIVAYRTKDQHGYQNIFAEVTEVREDGYVSLKTVPDGTNLLIKEQALTKVKTVWQDTMRQVQNLPVSDKHPHYGCLQSMGVVLSRYQDIEDALEDNSLSNKQKLKHIRKLNSQIGEIVTEYLPG